MKHHQIRLFSTRRMLITVIMIACSYGAVYSQTSSYTYFPTYEATIQNQTVLGSDFYFDLYLRSTGPGNIFFSLNQITLTFNSSAFTSPSFEFFPDDESSVTLVNSLNNSVAIGYYGNTATSVASNELRIAFFPIVAGSETELNTLIANIDHRANVHRYGRFKVSGISDPSQSMNLQWKTSGTSETMLFSYDSTSGPVYQSYRMTGTLVPPQNTPLGVPYFGEGTIANQRVVGSDFLFDVYLRSTTTQDLYLGNGQFIFTFNSAAFTNPVLSLQPNDVSAFSLTNSNATSPAAFYLANTSLSISGNELRVSINQPVFTTQTQFDARIARIDQQPATHLYGKFKVSGITDPTAFMNLQWKTVTNPFSRIFSLENVTPWFGSEVGMTWTNPPNTPLPVELVSFSAQLRDRRVHLRWETATETNNHGFEIQREVQRSFDRSEWQTIGFMQGAGTSSAPRQYTYVDDLTGTMPDAAVVNYRLRQLDRDGTVSFSETVSVRLAGTIDLEVSPMPVRSTSTLRFVLAEQSSVDLVVTDCLGREVRRYHHDAMLAAGNHVTTFNAADLPAGLYMCRLRTSAGTFVRPILIVR